MISGQQITSIHGEICNTAHTSQNLAEETMLQGLFPRVHPDDTILISNMSPPLRRDLSMKWWCLRESKDDMLARGDKIEGG